MAIMPQFSCLVLLVAFTVQCYSEVRTLQTSTIPIAPRDDSSKYYRMRDRPSKAYTEKTLNAVYAFGVTEPPKSVYTPFNKLPGAKLQGYYNSSKSSHPFIQRAVELRVDGYYSPNKQKQKIKPLSKATDPTIHVDYTTNAYAQWIDTGKKRIVAQEAAPTTTYQKATSYHGSDTTGYEKLRKTLRQLNITKPNYGQRKRNLIVHPQLNSTMDGWKPLVPQESKHNYKTSYNIVGKYKRNQNRQGNFDLIPSVGFSYSYTYSPNSRSYLKKTVKPTQSKPSKYLAHPAPNSILQDSYNPRSVLKYRKATNTVDVDKARVKNFRPSQPLGNPIVSSNLHYSPESLHVVYENSPGQGNLVSPNLPHIIHGAPQHVPDLPNDQPFSNIQAILTESDREKYSGRQKKELLIEHSSIGQSTPPSVYVAHDNIPNPLDDFVDPTSYTVTTPHIPSEQKLQFNPVLYNLPDTGNPYNQYSIADSPIMKESPIFHIPMDPGTRGSHLQNPYSFDVSLDKFGPYDVKGSSTLSQYAPQFSGYNNIYPVSDHPSTLSVPYPNHLEPTAVPMPVQPAFEPTDYGQVFNHPVESSYRNLDYGDRPISDPITEYNDEKPYLYNQNVMHVDNSYIFNPVPKPPIFQTVY